MPSGEWSRPGSSPDSRVWCAMLASRKTLRRTLLWPRWSSGRSRVSRTIRAPGSWPRPNIAPSIMFRRRTRGWSPNTKSSAASWRPAGDGRAGSRRSDRRRNWRRPAPPGVHLLPPGALHRSPRRAHPASARRLDHRRDRARISLSGAHCRAAHCPRQAHPCRKPTCPFEVPRGAELAAPGRPCWKSST